MDELIDISELSPSDRDAVVDVLCAAFSGYPYMDYVIGAKAAAGSPRYEALLRALLEFYTDIYLAGGWPVVGARAGDSLVAVSLSSPPQATDPPEIERLAFEARAKLGETIYERVESLEGEYDGMEPEAPHLSVGLLGVLPTRHGLGLGRALIEESKRRAAATGCAGVWLTTETPVNVEIYRRMGFEVFVEKSFGELTTWGLACSVIQQPGTRSASR